MVIIKSAAEIAQIRRACGVVKEILECLPDRIAPGVTTRELDRWAEKLIRKRGGLPAFKGYRGFPATLCTSINEVVVHGIPGEQTLRAGDLISIDVGVKLGGWFGDGARTYPVAEVSAEARRLMRVTRESLELAIGQVKPGAYLSDIGHAVQKHVEGAGFSVVRDFVGHGIGRDLHEEPQIPNFGETGRGLRLKPGMVLAIEPMVNAGAYGVVVQEDRWTAKTQDGSLSAHFEHTVAVSQDGAEVLTL